MWRIYIYILYIYIYIKLQVISGGPSTLYKNLPPRVDSSCQETLRVLGPLRSLLVVIGVFFSFFLKHNELLLSGLLYIARFFLKIWFQIKRHFKNRCASIRSVQCNIIRMSFYDQRRRLIILIFCCVGNHRLQISSRTRCFWLWSKEWINLHNQSK